MATNNQQGMPQPTPQVQPVAPAATPLVPQTWWQKSKATFWSLVSNRYTKIFFIILLLISMVFIGAVINRATTGSESSENTSSTTVISGGQQIPVTINGKDTVVTVGEFFPVNYQSVKPSNFSLEFNFNKFSDYRMENQNDSNYWKQIKTGQPVKGNESLPDSWDNGNIYIWGKSPGVAYFRIYDPKK